MWMRFSAALACCFVLSACGERAQETSAADALEVMPEDVAQAQREARAVREHFYGDGKSNYTPQPVDGL
ncbi:hypothetical protein ACSBPU_18805 [Parapusillimonas sp. JC17]|uniref:hypothetical protein n=1 Tax=Parapusillimonas sp. JC17 TaxID=3445768 RepID=UPI003FA165D1